MNIAVVTGASSGMGREAVIQIADRFSGKGIDEIWVVARRAGQLEELRKQVPVPLRIFGLDLMQEESRQILEWEMRQRPIKVRILVNAAGYGQMGPVEEADQEEESGMVRLNCEALCALTHIVLSFMPDHGRILLFASSAGFVPQPGFAVYAATKAFVLSYGRALNTELKKRDIVVTSVCPGPVDTEFFHTRGMEGKFPAYKQMAIANPRKVVRQALRDSMMGKSVSVYGPMMKGFRLLCKVIPHSLLLNLMERITMKKTESEEKGRP